MRLFEHCFSDSLQSFNYKIQGWNPEKNLVIAGISPKKEKTLPINIWKNVIKEIEKTGFKVKTVDHDIGESHIHTPTIAHLKDELSKAQFFIGTDSGVAHLADILGIPSLIMFGSTSIAKNKPYQKKSIVMSRKLGCSPCFDWGRINCKINYDCMNFEFNQIMKNFNKLIKQQD